PPPEPPVRSLCVLVLVSTVLGCRERKQAGYFSSDSSATVARQERRLGYDKNGRPTPVALEGVVVTDANPLPSISAPDVTNMIIRTATASIEVDSLQPAIAQLRALAARVGGYVANSNVETGKNQLPEAEIELKIPAV